jgi:hypothetical protein
MFQRHTTATRIDSIFPLFFSTNAGSQWCMRYGRSQPRTKETTIQAINHTPLKVHNDPAFPSSPLELASRKQGKNLTGHGTSKGDDALWSAGTPQPYAPIWVGESGEACSCFGKSLSSCQQALTFEFRALKLMAWLHFREMVYYFCYFNSFDDDFCILLLTDYRPLPPGYEPDSVNI